MSKRAIFFDRDGVINTAIFRDGKPASPRQLNEWQWEPHVQTVMQQLKSQGYLCFVVTNQPDVARGLLDESELKSMHEKMRTELPIDDLQVCTHDDYHQCLCRKPKPGMLLTLARQWNVDLNQSFFIGDSWKDVDAGKAAGCSTVLLQRDYNRDIQADYVISDLSEFIELVGAN